MSHPQVDQTVFKGEKTDRIERRCIRARKRERGMCQARANAVSRLQARCYEIQQTGSIIWWGEVWVIQTHHTWGLTGFTGREFEVER